MSDYDSKPDTIEHIRTVRTILMRVIQELTRRADEHDRTKLEDPEKAYFDEYTPKLEQCTYGSEEYKEYLDELDNALQHHYAEYRHHPEHHDNGIQDMHLVDLLEMLVDWRAATERHADGDIRESIEHNADRFGYGEELEQILHNTADFIEDIFVEGYSRREDDE